MSKILKMILTLAVIVVLAGGGRLVYRHFFSASAAAFPSSAPAAPAAATSSALLLPKRTPPAGQLEFYNAQYRFALFYPANLVEQIYDEGNGASTFDFETSDYSQGFEVFVVPYDKTQIDQARFAMDEPSGTLNDPTDITIAGAPAVMFFGNNSIMGDTREVWFVRGGYLFEVTTYKDLDSWLSQIMATWEFI